MTKLTSLVDGKAYEVNSSNVDEFYEEHVRLASAGSSIGDVIRLSGTILLKLFNPGGDLIDARAIRNLVVNTGRSAVIDRLQAASPAVHDYMAVGTGTTAAAAADTTLETEIGTRVQGTLSQPDAYTDRLVSTFAAGNATGAITETGRLNAASVGNLMGRQVFSVINKGAADALTVTYDFTYAAG